MRILITGSRDWDDDAAIWEALALTDAREWHTLVSGACPTGADRIAEHVAETFRWTVERHPADWSRGRGAGPERNAHMVSLGADLCLAFIKNNSRGASGTADMAEAAGIPTVRHIR